MNGELVADISKGERDLTGCQIVEVYSKVSKKYAVYGTKERVMVHFADDPALGTQQRKALAPLNPIRGEINGLLDGWKGDRAFNKAKKQRMVKFFDRRTADALTVALQGDADHGLELLKAVQAEILEERVSIGRVEYLLVAAACAAALFGVFAFLSQSGAEVATSGSVLQFIATNHIWLAASFGSLGALFSIALNIRSRQMQPDMQRRENIIDAILRVLIGAVSAVILFSLLNSELVALSLGEAEIRVLNPVTDDGESPKYLHIAIVVAFLAGFSERLVGDFLSTTVLSGIAAAAADKAAARPDDTAVRAANEENPLGILPGDIGEGAKKPPETEHAEHMHGDEHEDVCVCDVALDDTELTDDSELPEASGGIEKPA